ncbi:MAG: hypothetical protein KQJ78_15535 [Deltaproteobacteria bacterium]|nr:hypothetical protein [Deltaproteobacteria bacterium]
MWQLTKSLSAGSPPAARVLARGPAAWSYLVVRLALAGLFLAAGALKLLDLDAFAKTIAAFGLLPGFLVPWAALLLPPLEIVAALALALDRPLGLAAVSGFLVLFLLVLLYALWLGLDIDCGCYGPGDPEGEAFHSLRTSLYRDLGMLAGAGYLYWLRLLKARRGRLAPSRLSNQDDERCVLHRSSGSLGKSVVLPKLANHTPIRLAIWRAIHGPHEADGNQRSVER